MDSLTILALKKAESGGGGGGDITVESLSVSQNGTYTATTGKAYSPVTVAVPQTTVSSLSVTENGTYTATAGTAYSPISVAVPQTTVTSLSVTENGTYTATEGTAYSPVTVNVPTGGGSNWTLIGSAEFNVNTTSTSESAVGTISLTNYTPDKNVIVWVYIRDKAGKRNDYFFGSDTIFINYRLANGNKGTVSTKSVSSLYIYNNTYNMNTATAYGVYGYSLNNEDNKHEIVIKSKYNSSSTRTIDGTFKCDVYMLTVPTGMAMFD